MIMGKLTSTLQSISIRLVFSSSIIDSKHEQSFLRSKVAPAIKRGLLFITLAAYTNCLPLTVSAIVAPPLIALLANVRTFSDCQMSLFFTT